MPSPSIIALATGAAWFLLFVTLHIASFRAGAGGAQSLIRAYAISMAGTLITAVSLAVATGTTDPLRLVLVATIGSLTSACLFILYVPAVYTILASQSVQTMIMLRIHQGAIPEAALYNHFANRSVVEGRLKTLMASGYIASEESQYRLTSRGRAFARSFTALKKLWKLGPGG